MAAAIGPKRAKARVLAGLAALGLGTGVGIAARRIVGTIISDRQIAAYRDYWQERDHQGRFRWVVLGDSAAQAVGARHPSRGYVGLVEERLRERGFDVATINLSVSGSTAQDVVHDQLPLLGDLADTDLVTCVVGGNDAAQWRQFDPEQFGAALDQIAARLPAWSVLGEVPYFGIWPYEEVVTTANEIIADTARAHGLVVAPIHRATRALFPKGYLTALAHDFFHPNERGYRAWAQGLWAGIEQVLPPRATSGEPEARC